MLDSRISVAPGALRNPFGNAAVGAIRAVQPVVRRDGAERAPERTQPAQVAAPESATYTPSAARNERAPLYSRTGAPAESSGVFAAASVERNSAFELTVQTAEGDVATLSFSSDSTFSLAGVASGANQALAADASESSKLQVSVQGNLNDAELASINKLAQQVSAVADDFFGGDMNAALKSASRIDISTQADTLSAYAFSMQTQETRAATAMYEDVARSTAPLDVRPAQTTIDALPNAAPLPPTPPARDGKAFMQSLLALFDDLTQGLTQGQNDAVAANGKALASGSPTTPTA